MWTFKKDDDIFDAEFDTAQAAQDFAENAFSEQCSEEGERGSASADIELIQFDYDDDGERVIKQTIPATIEYEYYHGDLAEHGTWHSGGGGVL